MVKNIVLKSKLKVEGLDVKEMAMFLRKNMSTKDISDSTFSDCIPIKLKKPKNSSNAKYVDLWEYPDHTPTSEEIKCMWAETLALLVKLAMDNHIIRYGNDFIIQKDEGSIGVRLTGILAEIVMLIWCKLLKEKLSTAGIVNSVLNRFVDDITTIQQVIPEGMKLVNGKLQFCQIKLEEDKAIPGDVRTMKVIKEIADTIDEDITVTYDTPSNNKFLT